MENTLLLNREEENKELGYDPVRCLEFIVFAINEFVDDYKELKKKALKTKLPEDIEAAAKQRKFLLNCWMLQHVDSDMEYILDTVDKLLAGEKIKYV